MHNRKQGCCIRYLKPSSREVVLGLSVLAAGILISANAEAGWFSGQTFAIPMEEGTTFGYMINKYFALATQAALGGLLFKAAFFLALLTTFVRLGIGDKGSIIAFAKYLLVVALLSAPMFNGKSLLITAADAADTMFDSIVVAAGGLDATYAGGGAMSLMAMNVGDLAVEKKYGHEIANFKSDCYRPASDNYFKKTGLQPKGGANSSDLDYASIAVEQGDIPSTEATNLSQTTPTYTCADFKSYLLNNLGETRANALQNYVELAQTGQEAGIKFNNNEINLLSKAESIPPSDVLDDAVARSLDKTQYNEEHPGWGTQIKQFYANWGKAGFGHDFLTTTMVFLRIKIMEIGLIVFYIFDYYIFEVVAIIKTLAAMGMGLGILYYMFFWDINIPLTALGIWVFSDGLYVVACIILNEFWKKVGDAGIISGTLGSLTGVKAAVNDGLFAIAFMGLAATLFAGVLTWEALHVTMAFFGSSLNPHSAKFPNGEKGKAAAAK